MTLPRPQLLKKEFSVPDIIAGGTLAATAGAVMYNVGYVGRIGLSSMSLLSLQDLLTGAAVSLFFGVFVLATIGAIGLAPKEPRWARITALLIILASVSWLSVDQMFRLTWLRYELVTIIGCTGMILVTYWIFVRRRGNSTLALIVATCAVSPMLFGIAIAQGTLSSIDTTILEMKDGTSIAGSLYRLTSSHAFLIQGQDVAIVPMDGVRVVRRKDLL